MTSIYKGENLSSGKSPPLFAAAVDVVRETGFLGRALYKQLGDLLSQVRDAHFVMVKISLHAWDS